jgi:peptidoglycan/xylan/chitin deacetylase (PgdA/CDA1 family)
MPLLSPGDKRREVAESKRWCEQLTARETHGFAYPFGDMDDDCVAAVREAGFRYACAATPSVLGRRANPMRLPRCQVGDWDGARFEQWLDRGCTEP